MTAHAPAYRWMKRERNAFSKATCKYLQTLDLAGPRDLGSLGATDINTLGLLVQVLFLDTSRPPWMGDHQSKMMLAISSLRVFGFHGWIALADDPLAEELRLSLPKMTPQEELACFGRPMVKLGDLGVLDDYGVPAPAGCRAYVSGPHAEG
jgi:hypothetical protein